MILNSAFLSIAQILIKYGAEYFHVIYRFIRIQMLSAGGQVIVIHIRAGINGKFLPKE